MLARLVRAVLPTLLMLEAAWWGVSIYTLLPSLPRRGALSISLIALRAAVSVAEFAAAWVLRIGRPFAVSLSRGVLAASAVLLVFEIGLRLAPSNLDPSFRWHVVAVYAVYAVVVSTILPMTPPDSSSR
jgi:hypothetical protein